MKGGCVGVSVLHNRASNKINLDKEIMGWNGTVTKSIDRHISVMVGWLEFDITVVYAVAINWSLQVTPNGFWSD